jgi:hypothetical protein
MAASYKWQFKSKFRANAYGWRGSKLAITRLKEAVKEIRTVAKADPVAAGDGCVALMERLWPALQHIDTSSGALGIHDPVGLGLRRGEALGNVDRDSLEP